MLNIIHIVICLFILGTCVYRATKSDPTLREEVRWAIAVLGMASVAGSLQWLWSVAPNPFQIIMESAIAMMQWFYTRLWKDGIPEKFKKPQ